MTRLRPGGLIALDNVLRGGRVVDPRADAESDLMIQSDLVMKRLNDAIVADPRVDSVMLPVRDGVTLVRKR